MTRSDPTRRRTLTVASDRTALAPTLLALLALLGAAAAVGPGVAQGASIAQEAGVAQADRPTVRVVGGSVAGGGTTTVAIELTAAPEGLAGYYLRLSVRPGGVARIEGASYPDRFAMTTDPAVGSDGRTVALEAADLDGSVEPGATDVTLATVRVSGVSPGEAQVTVEPVQFDADDGGAFDPTARSDVLTVTPSDRDDASAGNDGTGRTAASPTAASGEGNTPAADSTGPDGSGDGESGGAGTPTVVLVAAAATLLGAGLAIGRRW